MMIQPNNYHELGTNELVIKHNYRFVNQVVIGQPAPFYASFVP